MTEKTRKAECDACKMVRTVKYYENVQLEMCHSCATAPYADSLTRSELGQMLLVINAKLDLLLGQKR